MNGNWKQLDAAGAAPGMPTGPSQGGLGTPSGGGGAGLSGIVGGMQAPISYEFGVESDLGLYGYGDQYGLDGTQHTGIDIAVPYGTNFYAPMAGTVTCAGTGVGMGADGGGCAAFNDLMGGGAGRVEVKLDNGVVLIYGHASADALPVGYHFQAGQLLGASGGENGAHIHLEARVPDASTPSGWRIVDPRTVLGGGIATGYGGGTVYQAPVNSYYANWAANRRG